MSEPPRRDRPVLGVDENGLGPLLGPLVVTAVLARVEPRAEALARRPARGALAERLGDSKGLVAYGDGALAEAWARALARLEGRDPATPLALFDALSLDPREALAAPCPSHHADLCLRDDGAFETDEAAVARCTRDLAALARRGLRVESARVIAVCNQRLNEAAGRGVSRFDVDLHAMERHALDARARAGEDLEAVCGKVGGIGRYGPRFGPLAGRLHATLAEGQAESRYRFPGLGELAFVRDADERHLLVGLASLAGKWARDHLTSRVVGYLRARDPSLTDASGYHDPVTLRLVGASALVRREARIEDACFLRRNAEPRARRST